jgi:hypothetical protein
MTHVEPSLPLCSLYVTLELVKLIQCMYAAADRKMYDASSDTPFVYKTTTLNEVRPPTLEPGLDLADIARRPEGRLRHMSCSFAGSWAGRVCAVRQDRCGAVRLTILMTGTLNVKALQLPRAQAR